MSPDKLSPLASVAETRSVLEAHGLATKKSLGQNFLINDDILKKIVKLAQVEPEDCILEVGPGIGTLTIALLRQGARVISVERDPDLPPVLQETTAQWSDQFHLISADALDLTSQDVEQAMRELAHGDALQAKLPAKLVANLPYAVAATVVLDYFEQFDFLRSATVMVQKEVADRMEAAPGNKNYGAYTVKLRLHAEPAGRFSVGPGNFFPPPRVESSVLRLNRRELTDDQGRPLSAELIQAASLMADAAFANRRKTIANSCRTFFKGRGAQGAQIAGRLSEIFQNAQIEPSVRGEVLTIEDYLRLGSALLRAQAD